MGECHNNCWLNGKSKGEHYPSCPLNLQTRTAAMLRSLEWASWGYNGDDKDKCAGLEESCPSCRALKVEDNAQHRHGCTLAALLRDLP